MTLQNKTSRLRAVATKVALGLGIALVASSIAPLAVAPASASAGDYVLFLDSGKVSKFTDNSTTGNLASTATTDASIQGIAANTNAFFLMSQNAGPMYFTVSGSTILKSNGGGSTQIFPGNLAVSNTVPTAVYADANYVYMAVVNTVTHLASIYRQGIYGGPDPEVVVSGIADGVNGVSAIAVVGSKLYYTFVMNDHGAESLQLRSFAFTSLPYTWTNAGASAPVMLGAADSADAHGSHEILVDGTTLYVPLGYSVAQANVGGLAVIDTANSDAKTSGSIPSGMSKVVYVSRLAGVTYYSGVDSSGNPLLARSVAGSDAAWSASIPAETAAWVVEGPRVQVTFSPNRGGGTGTGTMNMVSVSPGASYTLPANQFTNSGLSFRGWSTNQYATTVAYQDQQSVTIPQFGLSLYAIWAYPVSYDANGGTGTTPATTYAVPNGGVANVTLTTPSGLTKNGVSILGWDTTANSTCPAYVTGNLSAMVSAARTFYAIYDNSTCYNPNQNQNQNQNPNQNQNQNQNLNGPSSHTVTFNPNGGSGNAVVLTGISITIPAGPTHANNACSFLGWNISPTASTPNSPPIGQSVGFINDYTFYAVWSSASCRPQQQQNNAPAAAPAPQLDLGGLKTIPAPSAGVTGGTAGINLEGKNLPTVSSVTVAGKDGKVVTSTDTALKLELPTLAPGSYDIVMKTAGNGSITIQNGLVIAPPVDTKPVEPVVLTPSIPRTKLVAAAAPVPGFVAGKAGISEAQKAIVQDIVLTKNVTSLQCVGVTSAKVSAKLAAARAAAICAEAKSQNAAITTSVKTISAARVSGPLASVIVNYNH